jgi:hypothetical protein
MFSAFFKSVDQRFVVILSEELTKHAWFAMAPTPRPHLHLHIFLVSGHPVVLGQKVTAFSPVALISFVS